MQLHVAVQPRRLSRFKTSFLFRIVNISRSDRSKIRRDGTSPGKSRERLRVPLSSRDIETRWYKSLDRIESWNRESIPEWKGTKILRMFQKTRDYLRMRKLNLRAPFPPPLFDDFLKNIYRFNSSRVRNYYPNVASHLNSFQTLLAMKYN